MGPISGIDSSIFIYLLEEDDVFADAAEKILSRVRRGECNGILSLIGVIEILTGPKAEGKFELAQKYKDLLRTFPHLTIAGMNEHIVDLASDVRAKYRLRTPDAIHVATAIDSGAEEFITNDDTLARVKEIKVRLLKSL